MVKKMVSWFLKGLVEPVVLSLAIFDALLMFMCSQNDGHVQVYLMVIIILCDFAILTAHGAWIESRNSKSGDESESPRYPWISSPYPLIIRITSFAIQTWVLMAVNPPNPVLTACVWCIATTMAIFYAFYSILHAMHERNNTWLEGANGRIGTPNWISISRMAISVLVPYLYVVQPFGNVSSLIATIMLAAAIATDAIDGFVARRLNQITKAGKALDPLSDKVIFYPTAIAFLIATKGTAFLTTTPLLVIFYVCMFVMFARDVLVFVWFFAHYTKLKEGTGASLADKIRMVFMCIWLGAAVLTLTVGPTAFLMTTCFASMVIIAALSLISVAVDYDRVLPYIKK